MHRLIASTETISSGRAELSGEARRHLRVLRLREGECVELFDGAGAARTYRFASGELVPSGDMRFRPRPSVGMALFACVTKGSRWDWTVEKATELGATRIVPVISERTIVRIPQGERPAKRERWMRIAEDAARQSDAAWLPEVSQAVDFGEALALARETVCFAGALTSPPPEPLALAVGRHFESRSPDDARDISVFVGPEGDFTPDELASLLEFATPTSFGDSVLRAETAAVFGLSVMSAVVQAAQRKKL